MERRQANHRQLELFVAETPPTPIPLERRLRLVPLIGMLLAEAASIPTAAEETDHEDHA
jgi:hypothetical protein